MRWIVFFLFILNGVLLAWFVFDKGQQEQVEENAIGDQFDFSAVNRIRLLSELSNTELQQRDIRSTVSEVSSGESLSEGGDECLVLGPFLEVISARQAKSRLGEKGLDSNIVIILKELPVINWVYIAPQSDRKKALVLLKDLQSKNIDSFLIADGEYENGISLGFFSSLESAKAVLEQRAKEGYPVSLAKKKREQKTFWLAFDQAMSMKLQNVSLDSLEEGSFSIKRQQKKCAEVALLQIIE